MSDDSDVNKKLEAPGDPISEREDLNKSGAESSLSTLRETIANEERPQEKTLKKTGLLQRVTDVLHLRQGDKQKTAELAPIDEKEAGLESRVVLVPEKPLEISPEVEEPAALNEAVETPVNELDSGSSREGSIFDLLAQVQRDGLEHEKPPEPSTTEAEPFIGEAEMNQLQGSDNNLPSSTEDAPGQPSASGDELPQDRVMTTASLASRLWGLQGLTSDVDEVLPDEPDKTPPVDQTLETKSQEGAGKRTFFDRLKGPQSGEKDSSEFQIDDDEVLDRIRRTTGELHAAAESSRPVQPPKKSPQQSSFSDDLKNEKEDDKSRRFTYYPQIEDEGTSDLSGSPASNPNSNVPLVNDQPVYIATNIENAPPFSTRDEGWIGPVTPVEEAPVSLSTPLSEQTASTDEVPSGIEEFLHESKPESWPGQEVTRPAELQSWQENNLDDMRSILLTQPDEQGAGSIPPPESLLEEGTRIPSKPISRWASLPIYAKVILVVSALLVISIAVIFFSLANRLPRDQKAPFQPTTTLSGLPHPSYVTLPGGWSFDLTASTLTSPIAVSGTGAWLRGSEVRRVVELPWNKQVEAVIHTFENGNLIQLGFDDNTTIDYKIQGIQRVKTTDTTILTGVNPSLAIVLAGEPGDQRWVVIAIP